VQFLLGDWEIRAHRIRTDRKYDSVESGFALPGRVAETMSDAVLSQAGAVSALLDIGALREATVMPVMPNTSLMFPHASVPVLRTTIEPGETTLIAAVYANPSNDALPAAPSTNEIFSKLGAAGFRATASNETAARSRPELLVNS
jgi:hypothetical protein